jgi:hypothetical protein
VLFWTALIAAPAAFLSLGIASLVFCLRQDSASSRAAADPSSAFEVSEMTQPAPSADPPGPEEAHPVLLGPSVAPAIIKSSQPAPSKAVSDTVLKAVKPASDSADAKLKTGAETKVGTSQLVVAFGKGEPLPSAFAGGIAKPGPAANMAVMPKGMLLEDPLHDPAVNRAIDRGVAYLKKADDFRIGGKALAGLTLLSCGVPEKDPAVKRLAAAVRAGLPLTATYELALCLLFLDRLADSQDNVWIRRIALQLIAGQGIQGGWNYHCFALNTKQEKKLLALLQAPVRWVSDKQVFTLRRQPGQGAPADLRDLCVMQYRPGQQMRFQPSLWHEDNSLTQFVILALWTAQKHGIPAERSLAMIEARFRASQNVDGSWGYKWDQSFMGGSFRADSMTCAGLLGLAAGYAVRPNLPEKTLPALRGPIAKAPKKHANNAGGDRAIENALMFLSQKIGVPVPKELAAAEQMKANALFMNLQIQLAQAPPAQRLLLVKKLQTLAKIDNRLKARGTIVGANARGDLYYLWSLERVGVAYDLRTIGGKDWYAWGAPLIVAHQQDDGSWSDLYPGVPDTCFALLFLRRVNVARDLTRSLQRLPLAREAAGRMSDLSLPGASPGERMHVAEPKGPPLRTRE